MVRLAALLVVAAAASAAAQAAPPRGTVSVEYFGQPNRSAETFARPLGATIGLFRRGRAVRLPAPRGGMLSLPAVAAQLRGHPGALRLARVRSVTTPLGTIYLVPTARGWLCLQGPTFETCHRGLLRQGVTWQFWTDPTGIDVLGIASDDVRAVDLVWKGHRVAARLAHNVFTVHRDMALTSGKHLPPLGTLAVLHRGVARPASVPLR